MSEEESGREGGRERGAHVALIHSSVSLSLPSQASLAEGYKIIDSDELRAAMNALVEDIAGVLVRDCVDRAWRSACPSLVP